MDRVVRRRDYRLRFIIPGIFIAIFLFVFLAQRFKNLDDLADAASLANFDPGYIISDYQMGNYNSMNEAEIQAFLKSKNSCNDTNLSRYTYGNKVDYYSETTPYTWHVDSGHFVCMADEMINGETAAHIIWQAAQDFRINPQVLIVVLQKEQAIVTDTFPHSIQYRSAMGYGCPDTAPCSPSYAGFRNQVRNAAEMFRTVLDGGWTNYPVGDNYIQYNPSAACGGSVVNIKNRATSAMYRYTPYQPNAGALAAGYGTAYCGAYGNRNFYLYFEDWFGGVRSEGVEYVPLITPRFMETIEDSKRINPKTQEVVDEIEGGRLLKFVTKAIFKDGTSCLRTEFGTIYNEDKCLMMDSLKEIELNYDIVPEENRNKIIKANSEKYFIRGESIAQTFNDKMVREVFATTDFNGKKYYITKFDFENNSSEYGFLAEDVVDAPEYILLEEVKEMTPTHDSVRLNPMTGEFYSNFEKNIVYTFASYIVVDGVKYYRTLHNTVNNINAAVSEDDLREVSFVEIEEPGYFKLRKDVERINPITKDVFDLLDEGRIIKFKSKLLVDGQWYYRTEHNSNNNFCLAIPFSDLEEL